MKGYLEKAEYTRYQDDYKRISVFFEGNREDIFPKSYLESQKVRYQITIPKKDGKADFDSLADGNIPVVAFRIYCNEEIQGGAEGLYLTKEEKIAMVDRAREKSEELDCTLDGLEYEKDYEYEE